MEVKNIVMLGFGDMGKGIAQVCLMAGYHVIAVDLSDEIIEKGLEYNKSGFEKLESKGKLPKGISASDIMARLSVDKNLVEAVKDADLVIEAVVEKLDIKQKLCKEVIDNSPEHCIFASNTSSISITEIAQGCSKPENVIGMHFFNPAPLMRLIEVIKGEKSSEKAMEVGVNLSKTLPCLRGERYVASVLKDHPGFIVNRVLAPNALYQNYILDMAYEKGIPWEQVDADLSGPNAPMSSLTLADFTGRDIAYNAGLYYAEKLSPDFEPGKVLTMQYNKGTLGKKTGQGFYDWSKGRPQPDLSKKAGLVDRRIFAAISANEGCRILEEGVVKSWKIIDEAILAGMNFPGPMQYATTNYKELSEVLEGYSEKLNKSYLKPCELLKSGKFVEMV
ncbi:MAG: 3-hydroxyacyl-CoA dehydrogenase family protein [Candidatus Lokiarchaeota archaeon]|nr:3-hydroxyacyl-CoA dehydrogenase family protein [Candidatus Lokiarchaeota archaeon]